MSCPPRTEFGAPFNFADADLILLTSDNVIFRVHKGLLSFASTTIAVFPFELSADPADQHDGLPVFPLTTETRLGVEYTLRLVYPTSRPEWKTLAEVHAVLEIARKYQMETVTQMVAEMLDHSDFLRQQPLGVYALSYAYGLGDLTRRAARCTLSTPLAQLAEKEPAVLNATSGEAIYRLMEYNSACFRSVASALSLDSLRPMLKKHYLWNWIDCTEDKESCPQSSWIVKVDSILGGNARDAHVRKWWWSYIQQVEKNLEKSLDLDVFSRVDLLMTACAEAGACCSCKEYASKEMMDFLPLIKAHVERRISLVELVIKT